MKRFAALALVLIGLGMPAAFGQRGGGHGGGFGGGHGGGFGGGHGFSGGSAGGFHGGGFSAPHFSGGFSAAHFSGGFSAPRFSAGYAPRGLTAPRTYGNWGNDARYLPRYYRPYPVGSRSGYGYSSGYSHSGGNHHHGGDGFHWSITTVPNYATLVPGWIGIGPYGYYPGYYGWDDSGWNDDPPASSSDESANVAQQGYGPAPEQEQPVYREEYEPAAAMPVLPTPSPENQRVTTVVLNDGRSVQVQNYALTPTTLYVLDAQRRDIPLDQINVAATQQANRAVGIDFQVPKIAQ
jgi:hypothetical protein